MLREIARFGHRREPSSRQGLEVRDGEVALRRASLFRRLIRRRLCSQDSATTRCHGSSLRPLPRRRPLGNSTSSFHRHCHVRPRHTGRPKDSLRWSYRACRPPWGSSFPSGTGRRPRQKVRRCSRLGRSRSCRRCTGAFGRTQTERPWSYTLAVPDNRRPMNRPELSPSDKSRSGT